MRMGWEGDEHLDGNANGNENEICRWGGKATQFNSTQLSQGLYLHLVLRIYFSCNCAI